MDLDRQLPTSLLHDINWDTLNRASCGIRVCMCVSMCVHLCGCVSVCGLHCVYCS